MTETLFGLDAGVWKSILLGVRVLVPVLTAYVVWRSYTSFRKGQRGKEPIIMLWDEASGTRFPVVYWENSIGRSKSCDIYLPDPTASRDHAVLMRREEGWVICDTGSKSGVWLNGEKIRDRALVGVGDTLTLGSTTLSVWNSDAEPKLQRRRKFTGFSKQAASPFKLMMVTTLVVLLTAGQAALAGGVFRPRMLIPGGVVLVTGWALYAFMMGARHHVSFEMETVGILLSGIGINLLTAYDVQGVLSQVAAFVLGVGFFGFMVWFLGDLERVARFRLAIGIGALGVLALTLVIGRNIGGARNWIILGPLSIQPSELVKIGFIFVGTSTLDRLQTKKNITEFLIFAVACLGFLAIMNDFGTALIFFAGFLIIAFMRSGSVRTIILVVAAAGLGLLLILRFRPDTAVVTRLQLWGHVWDDMYGIGYQQSHALTYIASGGLFGVGLGQGYLASTFAADSDLVFALLCEEQGALLAFLVVLAIGMLILYARSDVTRSRSTFFSIAACAAAGMLVFQTCLNVFGPTDVLPFTGVTLPFISAGGSSMLSVWGMLAFLKASDERTYAARRASRHGGRPADPAPGGGRGRRDEGPAGRGAAPAPPRREMEDITS